MKTSVTDFLNYSFSGNGKYYTTEQGSRSYRNTTFQNFANKNAETFKVVGSGNDAPKGGKSGDFVIVEFTPEFLRAAKKFKADKDEAKQREQNAKEAQRLETQRVADLIPTVVGETREATCQRLSKSLDSKIEAGIFHKAIKIVRNRK